MRSLAVKLASLVLLGALGVGAVPATAEAAAALFPAWSDSYTSGPVTGRIMIEPMAGGAPVPANRGAVTIFQSQRPHEQTWTADVSADGEFSLPGLPTGVGDRIYYVVQFVSTDSRALPVREWFDDSRFTETIRFLTVEPATPHDFGDVVLERRSIGVDRLAGANRFGTAAAAAAKFVGPGEGRDVVIVNGMDFPDALSAGALAGRSQAPVLLVTRDTVPQETRNALARITPSSITIVGGEGAVSSFVEAEVARYTREPYRTTRLSGEDRYATSRAVVQRMASIAPIRELFLASGRDYPDALSAVPASARAGGAILLIKGTAPSLDASTAQFIQSFGVTTTLVGGSAAVSTGIESQLKALGVSVRRIWGADRYATSVAVANAYFPVLISTRAYIASGRGFADGLSIGSLIGQSGWPLLLSMSTCLPGAVHDAVIDRLPNGVTLVGGVGVLGEGVADLTPCT